MAETRRIAKPLSEEQIVEQAKITPDDVDRARQWWRSHAPSDLKDLLDAEPKAKRGEEVVPPE